MALPLGDIQAVKHSIREFWTVLKQILSNQYFNTFKFTLIPTVLLNDLDCAMAALVTDVTFTIEAQCREWHGV